MTSRITSSRAIDAHDVRTSPPVLQDKPNSSNDRDSNTSGQGEIVNNEVVSAQCVCGRQFKSRRGLRKHQCTCKTRKLLDDGIQDKSQPADQVDGEAEDLNGSCMSGSPEVRAQVDRLNADAEPSSVLPGVHLPRNGKDWEEANTFFNIKFMDALSLPIGNLDEFTKFFQKSVYEYFAENYGTVKKEGEEEENLRVMSVKELKKKLRGLKKHQEKGEEIHRVSKLIRRKLKGQTKDVSAEEMSSGNLNKQLFRKFWKTCEKLFKPAENILPKFTVEIGVKYFNSVLSKLRKQNFSTLPDWILKLPAPIFPFDISPPIYREISRAISKAKSRSSSCPFDQVNYIMLKRCPILRTVLQKIIVECWRTSSIPGCWKRGLTILIYKKGDPEDPSNFRPITLQPVLYKVLASVIRNRIYAFLEKNKFVDRKIQKGFWPTIDGVAEHTQVLSHVIRDAKRSQRSIVITLLDLKNAFGEVNHSLISASLKYHHVPPEITGLIQDIYSDSRVSIAVGNRNSRFIPVGRGVLQGDPCSPLLFNLCFNPLMRTLSQAKFEHLGYMWGPNADPRSRSWLQFADDTAIIANDVKNAQTLINLNVAWCKWAGMSLRIDKCTSFGMRKQEGLYQQYLPNLTVDNSRIPTVDLGASFKYLGKIFNFEMDNAEVKTQLVTRLSSILKITTNLKIKAQLKLKILKSYIPAQLNFDLRIYDLSYTWIEQNLDAAIVNAVNDWIELPHGSCTAEFLHLPSKLGGYGIPSLKMTAQKLRLSLRFILKNNVNNDLRDIWELSSKNNIHLDSLLEREPTKSAALLALNAEQLTRDVDHISTLKIQGRLLTAVREAFDEATVRKWAEMVSNLLPGTLFSFARKAFQQQLATASNLYRWKKIDSDKCSLCGAKQTNKHALNNCSSAAALSRYKRRHDSVLEILTKWLISSMKEECEIFVDLIGQTYRPISGVFRSLRPDIVIIQKKSISTLELTICHETNATTSKNFKISKYKNLKHNLLPEYAKYNLAHYTVEVTSLGFISDISDFCSLNLVTDKMPVHVEQALFRSVISSSYSIYCSRNAAAD